MINGRDITYVYVHIYVRYLLDVSEASFSGFNNSNFLQIYRVIANSKKV